VDTKSDFFSAPFYNTRMLRPVDAVPPRALGQRRQGITYLGKTLQTVTAVTLTAVLAVPAVAVAGTDSAQVIRSAQRRNRISGPANLQREIVDHGRVQMTPRQVLVFRRVVSPTRVMPRAVRQGPGEE
jgi:hypothetical protein